MESIGMYIQRIKELLDKTEDILEASKALPFSSKVTVDKVLLYEIVDEMRPMLEDMAKDLPNEITQAKRVIADSDRIITESRQKASQIIADAEREIVKLVSEHEISKLAVEQSAQIIEEAKVSSRDMRANVREYADEILSRSEAALREALDVLSRKLRETENQFSDSINIIYENRQELRGKGK